MSSTQVSPLNISVPLFSTSPYSTSLFLPIQKCGMRRLDRVPFKSFQTIARKFIPKYSLLICSA